MNNVRNDSNLSLEDALALMERDGVKICYGDIEMVVQTGALAEAHKWVADLHPDDRRKAKLSIDNALRRALPKMVKGNFSKKTANNFHADLLVWEALKAYAS